MIDYYRAEWIVANPDKAPARWTALGRAIPLRFERAQDPLGSYVWPNGDTFDSCIIDVIEKHGTVYFGRDRDANCRFRREDARADAWDWYEEIWQLAHDALKEAGAWSS